MRRLAFTTRGFPAGLTTRFATGCFFSASVFGFAAIGLEPFCGQRTSLLLQSTFKGVAARYGTFWRLVAASVCPAHTAIAITIITKAAKPGVKDDGLVKLSTGPPQVACASEYLPSTAESQSSGPGRSSQMIKKAGVAGPGHYGVCLQLTLPSAIAVIRFGAGLSESALRAAVVNSFPAIAPAIIASEGGF